MVPASIKRNLAGLRRRERLLTFVWGVACWLAIFMALLFLCGFVDWLIDRRRDTPLGVRLGMFLVQAMVAAVAGLLFVLWPQIRRLPDALMALWVEAKKPKFEHRLISAVQLNEPGADTAGMSRELIGVVTHEAEKLTERTGAFSQVADHRRLLWAILVVTPMLCVCGLPFAIWPKLSFALLCRQMLLPVDVPHSVQLTSTSPAVWPIGEDIPIQFKVEGAFADDMVGSLYVTPAGESTQRYDLEFHGQKDGVAVFGAYVKPSSVDITYTARLADGRTKIPTEMKLVPRPIVTSNRAFVQLPAYCGLKPAKQGVSVDERRYEVEAAKGDVVGIPGSAVRVEIQTQKDIKEAWLELLGSEIVDPKNAEARVDAKPDRRPMTVGSDKMSASARFDLNDRHIGYRVVVKDEHGFDNVPPPRRTLRVVPEEPPTIALLRNTFSDSREQADFDVEGLPVVIGGQIRIPYVCYGNYGLGKAQVMYRVLKKHESGSEPADEEDWVRAPLPEVNAPVAFGEIVSAVGADGKSVVVTSKKPHGLVSGEDVFIDDISGFDGISKKAHPITVLDANRFTLDGTGNLTGAGSGGVWVWVAVFNPKTGVFRHTPFDEQIEYHAVPSRDVQNVLGRTMGGGRYFLKTDGLLDRKTGKALKLKSGDQIEYCIKIYAADREPKYGDVPFAVSETRVSAVMTLTEFLAWNSSVNKEDERVRDLERRQKGVFAPK